MPRKNRHIVPGTIYHFIACFVASEWFIKSSVERHGYLSLLTDALARSDWKCLGFAVMSNHVHLVLIAGETTLASWLRSVHARFAEWINQRLGRKGAVFTRGPKMIAVRPEGVATLLAYVHNNPVRAGVVHRPGDSEWTSHAMYTGDEKAYPWLDVELGLQMAGFASGDDFDRWVSATKIEREHLDAMRVTPLRGPGRPRKEAPAGVASEVVNVATSEMIVSDGAACGVADIAASDASPVVATSGAATSGAATSGAATSGAAPSGGATSGAATSGAATSGVSMSVREHVDRLATSGVATTAREGGGGAAAEIAARRIVMSLHDELAGRVADIVANGAAHIAARSAMVRIARGGATGRIAASGAAGYTVANGVAAHVATSGATGHIAVSGATGHIAVSGAAGHIAASDVVAVSGATADVVARDVVAVSGATADVVVARDVAAVSGATGHIAASGVSSRVVVSDASSRVVVSDVMASSVAHGAAALGRTQLVVRRRGRSVVYACRDGPRGRRYIFTSATCEYSES